MTPRPIFDSSGARVRHYSLGPPKARKARATPEADFQKVLVTALGYALPEPYAFFASAVGTNVGKFKGGELKAMGIRDSWPDLNIVNLDTGAWRALECKSLTGSLEPGQKRLSERLGSKWQTVRTLDQAQHALRVVWRIPLIMPLAYADRYRAPVWGRMSEAERATAWIA